MVGLFVRLKLRLLANGLRTSPGQFIGLLVGLVWALLMASFGTFGLTLLRGQEQLAADVGVLVFTAIAVAWMLFPLFVFGSDETLDPARLALFPLRRRTLVAGLLAASAVGVPALATLLLLLGALVGLSAGPLSVLIGAVAVVLQLAMCIAASRALSCALSGVLRSRRGRDLGILVGVLLVFGVQGINVAFQRVSFEGAASPQALLALLDRVASALRWAPPGAAAQAISNAAGGRPLLAAGELALAAAAVGLLLWWWIAALSRALTGYDASTQATTAGRGRRVTGGVAAVLPTGRVGAVAAKELRYLWREPQRKASLIGAIALAILVGFAFGGGQAQSVLVLGPSVAAIVLGLQAANQFGLDGPALWLHVVATASARDLRNDIAGKNLALTLVALPLLAAISVAVGVIGTDVYGALAAFAVGCGMLGIGLGTASVTSVLAPYPVPERGTNVFRSPGAGTGPLVFAVSLGTMLVCGVLGAPIVLWFVLAGPSLPLLVTAPAYGAAVAWAGWRLATQQAVTRMPEILAAIEPGGRA